jgi:hypothetical protein
MIIVIRKFLNSTDIQIVEAMSETESLKRRILDACVIKQLSLINDFKNRLQSAVSYSGLGERQNAQNEETITYLTDETNRLIENLQYAETEMDKLHFLKQNIVQANTSHVEVGSVVVTDQMTFFVGVSADQFHVGPEIFVAISDNNPLFMAMKGKGKRESFIFNNVSYRILDIY